MNWNFRGQRWIVSDLKWQDLAWLIITVSLAWFRITLEIVLWLCVWGHPHGGFTEEEAILTWMWAALSHGPGDWGESKRKEKASWAPLSTFLCFLTCWDVSTAGGHSCHHASLMGYVLKLELERILPPLHRRQPPRNTREHSDFFPLQNRILPIFKLQLVCSLPRDLLHEHLQLSKYVLTGCGFSDPAEPEWFWTPSALQHCSLDSVSWNSGARCLLTC